MYKSPIEIIYGQTKTQIENDIFRAVQEYAINVDKDELIRALQYDRGQYKQGYADGRAAMLEELTQALCAHISGADAGGCYDGSCPAADRCAHKNNGMASLLREVLANDNK